LGSLRTHNVHEYEKVLGVEGPRCLDGAVQGAVRLGTTSPNTATPEPTLRGNERPERVRGKSVHAHTMRALAWDDPLAALVRKQNPA
jgi:hypothetical protein